MAIHIIPILKALAPLVANASGVVANLSSTKTAAGSDEKIRRLEEGAIKAGELLSAITEQTEAIARELKAQAEINEALERRARRATVVAWAAVAIALAALALAWALRT